MKAATPTEEVIRTRLGFLIKDSLVYGGAAAISQAFSLITFPLLTRHFAVEEYGVLDYFMVLSSFLVTLFIFGQDSATDRSALVRRDKMARQAHGRSARPLRREPQSAKEEQVDQRA